MQKLVCGISFFEMGCWPLAWMAFKGNWANAWRKIQSIATSYDDCCLQIQQQPGRNGRREMWFFYLICRLPEAIVENRMVDYMDLQQHLFYVINFRTTAATNPILPWYCISICVHVLHPTHSTNYLQYYCSLSPWNDSSIKKDHPQTGHLQDWNNDIYTPK